MVQSLEKRKKSNGKKYPLLEKISERATRWIGSVESLIVHTILFVSAFLLGIFGFSFEIILLALTTIVSLEAIYLAIFIQMTVNRNSEDLGELQEDIEDLEEDLEEISDEIEEDEKEEIARDRDMMQKIEKTLATLMKEIEEIKKK